MITEPVKESPDKIYEACTILASDLGGICSKLYTEDENNLMYKTAQNVYDELLGMIAENRSPDATGMKKVSDALNELYMTCERQKHKNALIPALLIDDVKNACLDAEKVMALMAEKASE